MIISLIVTNDENFKEIKEPSLTALGDLDWNDPIKYCTISKVLNNSCHEFVYNFYPQSILVLEKSGEIQT